MSPLEIQYMEALLKSLEKQRTQLNESIESIKEVLKYEHNINISMPKGKDKVKHG